MSAVRVARAATGRDRIIKFEGCYHGHADAFLVQAGSGALTLGMPTSPGVTRPPRPTRCVASYNDLASVAARCSTPTAARSPRVIVEPIAGNMGVVPPADGFLRGAARAVRRARRAADLRRGDFGIPRRGRAARRQLSGVRPDLTCLGKIIGGGLPVGAYGGRADLMELVSPAGPGLSGRHAVGQSAGDDGRHLVPRSADAEALSRPRGARRAAGRRARRRRARRRRRAAGERVRLGADAVLHRSAGARLRVGDERRHRSRTRVSSGACSRAASIRRRRSSRRGSCRRRTPRRMWTGRSPRRERRCGTCE